MKKEKRDGSNWNKLIKKYWDIEANNYDNSHLKIATSGLYVEQRRRECILPLINNTNINGKSLDAACGTGYYLQFFSNNECIGSDIAEKMIKRCREKGLENILVGDYEALPFKDNIFDMVLCINSFHYTKKPEKVLYEINRVLKEDGVVILTYFNFLNPRTTVHLIRDIFRVKTNIEQRYMHTSIQKMLNKAGFKVIESYGCNFSPYPVNGKKRNEAVLKFLEFFEKKIKRTPFKHLANEAILNLKKC